MIRLHRSPGFVALLVCATLALAAPWSATAAPRSPAGPGQDLEEIEEVEETTLSRAMEQMKGATRRLERVLQGDDAATALALLADFQAGVVAAKSEAPAKAQTLPEAGREAFVGEYRVTMVKLLRVTCDLEDALLDGRFEDARKIYEGELKALQKPSHERFRDED